MSQLDAIVDAMPLKPPRLTRSVGVDKLEMGVEMLKNAKATTGTRVLVCRQMSYTTQSCVYEIYIRKIGQFYKEEHDMV